MIPPFPSPQPHGDLHTNRERAEGKPASALIPFLKKERTPSVELRHPGDHNLGVSLVWITLTGTFSNRAGWLAATVAGFFYPLRELRQIVIEWMAATRLVHVPL